ncbi:MAG: histidine phosphatase family protein [Pseudomonadota bacterium]
MMKRGFTVYFARHGQTTWNAIRRIQGQINSELSERGQQQASAYATLLRPVIGEGTGYRFVASPLNRTVATMRLLREGLGLEPDAFERDDLLKEIHFGTWEGSMWGEVETKFPEAFAARAADPYGWAPEGGESYALLYDRIARWADTIDRDTVVVSHGGVSRVLRQHWLGLSPAEITELKVPQDKIMVFRDGAMTWLG